MVPLGTDGEEEATHAESIRIRGFSLKKAQTCELVFSEPGKYVVSMAGGGGSAVRGSVSMEFTTPGEHFIESSSSSSSSSSSPGAPRGGEVDGMDGMSLDERILAVLQKANMAPASGVPPPPGVGGGGGGGGDGGGETKAGVDGQRFGSGDGEDGEDDEARIDHAKESGDAEGKDANGGKGAGEGDDPSSTARAAPSVEEQSSGVRIHESGKSIWADIGGKGDEMEMEKAVVATKTTDRMMKMGLGLDDEDKQKAMTLMQEELDASHALQPLAGMGLEGQHALEGIGSFDELLDKGFVVETKEEGSGKKRRPREGDVVQVKVETYVSLVLCVCACARVRARVYVCELLIRTHPPLTLFALPHLYPPPLHPESPRRCGTPTRNCARVWHQCQRTLSWMEGFVGKVSTQQSIHGTCQARARRQCSRSVRAML